MMARKQMLENGRDTAQAGHPEHLGVLGSVDSPAIKMTERFAFVDCTALVCTGRPQACIHRLEI